MPKGLFVPRPGKEVDGRTTRWQKTKANEKKEVKKEKK